jgi:hypothetical protein
MRDYEQAQSVFEKAREADPHRIEHLDAYSNILYVRERRAELSYLAHRWVGADVVHLIDFSYYIDFMCVWVCVFACECVLVCVRVSDLLAA